DNGKTVTRAMRESAKQGFWNGAPPPLGYRAVEAERRGAKIKKKLDIDPVEAELVRLIFKLYLEGDGATGPLGVKGVASWLNANGYRTRKGATFGVGPLHGILTNRCYAIGKWPYGVRNARTGELNDPANIVEIDVPTIIPLNVFENVQARLAHNNPKVTPPRVVNGPTLLTGLAKCATCGSGMTRTGTVRRNRRYSYYSCAGCKQRGTSVCRGRNIPMEKLDSLVIEGMADKLLVPERVSYILDGLIERHAEKDRSVQERQQRLQAEIETITAKVTRLYAAIENDIIPLDDELTERIARLKAERDIARGSLDRIKSNLTAKAAITPAKIDQFTKLMRERLREGEVSARKAWLGSLIQKIEVDDQEIRISGSKEALSTALTGPLGQRPPVLGFVRKWRTQEDSNL
ncbi:MAG: recombinase family protein, partial [Sphingomonadales bacterium]